MCTAERLLLYITVEYRISPTVLVSVTLEDPPLTLTAPQKNTKVTIRGIVGTHRELGFKLSDLNFRVLNPTKP